MARACSICTHDQRENIERSLMSTRPLLRIAAEFKVAESSLRRHRNNHLEPALADALARRTEISADKLIAWVAGLNERTLAAIVRTEALRDWPNFRALVKEARENIVLLARLSGDLDSDRVIDARQQTLVLGRMTDEDLRALAAAAPDGSLGQAVERLALPEGEEAEFVPVEDTAG